MPKRKTSKFVKSSKATKSKVTTDMKKHTISLESVIGTIRDVLRTEGITGMNSINHCILFVVSRYLDEPLCNKLGIPMNFAYDNIMIDEDTGEEIGNQELYDNFYKKGDSNCVVGQFVNKIGFTNIKFKMENIHNLKKIMKLLQNLDLHTLNSRYDIIGTIYEIHLKSGTSNAMRDLGQYFTHRLVIKYMIELCDPQMKNGLIETIVDPTMGTGGFLSMAIKHLNKKYKHNVDWAKNKTNIYGFDIDENVRNMAVLNCMLETGELFDKTLLREDTLRNDMKLSKSRLEKADIILANEPMGLKNLVHAECCDRIKNMKIRGTKAEPLFLQLFMEALEDGGRCAVVIPDGVLFNEAKLHQETRKHLIENFNLKKVVSLDGDFFLNTGVKTSILYFINNGKTDKVEFCSIGMKGDEIQESNIVIAKLNDIIDNNYSLFVNKYNVKADVKLKGIKYMKLSDCTTIKSGKPINKDQRNGSLYPYFASNGISGYIDEYLFEGKYTITAQDGSIGSTHYYDGKFYPSNHVWIIESNSDILLSKYAYYVIKNIDFTAVITGSVIPKLKKQSLETYTIPVPPLEIQREIVERLDCLSDSIETMRVNIDQFKQIIRYYIESMTMEEKQIMLSSIVESIKTGKNKPSDNKTGTKYPYYGTSSITGYTDEYLFDGTFLITARNGTIGNVTKVSGKFFPSDHVFVIDIAKKENIDYMCYYIQNVIDLDSKKRGSTIPNITKKDIEDSMIKYPPKEKQREIVDYCNNITNMIKQLEKQIELNKELIRQIMDGYIKQCSIKSNSNKKNTKSKVIKTKKVEKSEEEFGESLDCSEPDFNEPDFNEPDFNEPVFNEPKRDVVKKSDSKRPGTKTKRMVKVVKRK